MVYVVVGAGPAAGDTLVGGDGLGPAALAASNA